MNVVTIEPGTETPRQRIDAIRALALSAASARADVDELEDRLEGMYRGEKRMAIMRLLDARYADMAIAEEALALEVAGSEDLLRMVSAQLAAGAV